MRRKKMYKRRRKAGIARHIVALSVVSVLAMILAWALPASAQPMCPAAGDAFCPDEMGDNICETGMTCVNGCMDDLFGGGLNCTANDVRVSGVADVNTNNLDGSCSPGPDGIVDECDITFALVCDTGASNAGDDCSGDPSVCLDSNGDPAPGLCGDKCAFAGDTTTFAATFIFELSAQERFDIAGYFAVDGDLNGDGALTGTCSISTLPEVGSFVRPGDGTGNFVDLDTTCKGGSCPQPEDLCGDIDNANNPIFYNLASTGSFIETDCRDPDGDGKLNLPSCTSWRQSGANEVCLNPTDAFPGSPSKCNCDPDFEVPINVPPAELQVVKTADPTSVDEPGGTVQFTVAVTNTGIDPNNNVTLNDLLDDIYGDITQVAGDIVGTTCSVPQIITPGGTYTCSFNATVSGNGGESQTDTVTASGVDDNSNPLSGMDDATVDILDVSPAISVTKTANPTSVIEGSMTEVTFTVVVDNDSLADPLTLTSLTDDLYGDITDNQNPAIESTTCSLETIPVDGSYSCDFTAIVDGQAVSSETDTVTAVGQDDETPANVVMASDSATVTILDSPAMIELIKTVSPLCSPGGDVNGPGCVNEPGANVTYTFTVNNLSPVDFVTINTLDDDIYGDLTAVPGSTCEVPQVLSPADMVSDMDTYSCSITVFVGGEGGDVVVNEATAEGVDDDIPTPNDLVAMDSATVNIRDVPPAASLTKTASMVVATFDVVVTNDSAAEALDLTQLNDDKFGNITQVQGDVLSTNCEVPQTIAIGGSYTCTFDGKINTSPHTDTVTGTVSDNEGGSVTPSDSATVTFN